MLHRVIVYLAYKYNLFNNPFKADTFFSMCDKGWLNGTCHDN